MSNLKLENGSKIGIVGGGPAGSFFAYFVLDLAKRLNINIDVDIYEPKNFAALGPKGCNNCGGIVSESLVQMMASEGIIIPDIVLQRGIDSYVLHTDSGSVTLDTPLEESRIAAIYRGGGPLKAENPTWESFDGHMQKLTQESGANIIHEIVSNISYDQDNKPMIQTKKSEAKTYDLIVGAAGSAPKFLKIFEDMNFGYKMPEFTKTSISEVYLGEELMKRHFGSSMHVFLLDIPRLIFAAIIPKGDYVTIAMLGEDVDKDLLKQFLDSPQVKGCFPDDMDLYTIRPCKCFPSMYLNSAVQPYGDRVVLIGDCASSKLYKNGIGAAFITAKAAATTAITHGISKNNFEEHYWDDCKTLNKDNFLGKIVFWVTGVIQRSDILKNGLVRKVFKEQSKKGQYRYLSSALWDTFTGSGSYTSIFKKFFNPKLFVPLIGDIITSIFSSKKYKYEKRGSIDTKSKLGKYYKQGETIITQGDMGDCMYVILEGSVDVFRKDNGFENNIASLHKSDFFGEMALFENDVRSATIKSSSDNTRILTIDKNILMYRIKAEPSMILRIIENMSNRLVNIANQKNINIDIPNINKVELLSTISNKPEIAFDMLEDISSKIRNLNKDKQEPLNQPECGCSI
jgi:flavin-dependent dehydrogenase